MSCELRHFDGLNTHARNRSRAVECPHPQQTMDPCDLAGTVVLYSADTVVVDSGQWVVFNFTREASLHLRTLTER